MTKKKVEASTDSVPVYAAVIVGLLLGLLKRIRTLEKYCHWHEPKLTKPLHPEGYGVDEELATIRELGENIRAAKTVPKKRNTKKRIEVKRS
jgi:hypothetical protein